MTTETMSRIATAVRRLNDMKPEMDDFADAVAIRNALPSLHQSLRTSAQNVLKARDEERRAQFTRLGLPMTYEAWLETKPRCTTRIGKEQCIHQIDHADNGSWCQAPGDPNPNTNPGPGNLLEWVK